MILYSYFVVFNYRCIEFVHQVVDHPEKAECGGVSWVELDDLVVRSLRF